MTATQQSATRGVARAGKRGHAYSTLHPDSPIALAWETCGMVRVTDGLRADIAHAVSAKDLSRAYALGVCSVTSGTAPDVHQRESHLWSDVTAPSDYLVAWITTALQWQRGERHATADNAVTRDADDERDAYQLQRAEQVDAYAVELITIAPTWYLDWLTRLIHAPKWQYLIEMGAAEWLHAPAPYDPGTEWSAKMDRQWVHRAQPRVDAVAA